MEQNVTGAAPLTLKSRRELYRQTMMDDIMATARAVMREQGVAALNLNEVARRLGASNQALARYFPSKAALYDALSVMGHRMFRMVEEEIWLTTAPDWGRIHRWFADRLALASEHSDLFELIWGAAVPGLTYSSLLREEISAMITGTRRGFQQIVDAGNLVVALPTERVVDIFLALRHGIIAEHLGKRTYLPPDSDRFSGLIPDVLAVFERAWGPEQVR